MTVPSFDVFYSSQQLIGCGSKGRQFVVFVAVLFFLQLSGKQLVLSNKTKHAVIRALSPLVINVQ
jgi:hypothetical protein